ADVGQIAGLYLHDVGSCLGESQLLLPVRIETNYRLAGGREHTGERKAASEPPRPCQCQRYDPVRLPAERVLVDLGCGGNAPLRERSAAHGSTWLHLWISLHDALPILADVGEIAGLYLHDVGSGLGESQLLLPVRI